MSLLHISPRVSEKAYGHSEKLNVYVFDVPTSANKVQIKAAIQEQYQVTVLKVRTTIQDGKKARSIRIGGRGKYVLGKRSDVKKAYATLKDGDSIPVFDSVTDGNTGEDK